MEFQMGISLWFVGWFVMAAIAESAALYYSRRFGRPLWLLNIALIFIGAAALFGLVERRLASSRRCSDRPRRGDPLRDHARRERWHVMKGNLF